MRTSHGAFGIGLVHGMGGSAGVGVLLLAAIPSRDVAIAALLVLALFTAVSMTIVTVGGWDALQGAKAIQVAYILIYLLLAFYIARWRSGLLPVAASFAIILLIFCAISGPQWFTRDKAGFEDPLLDEAWNRLMDMNVRNVHFRHGDGTLGWAEATWPLNEGRMDERTFMEDLYRAFDDRAQVILSRIDGEGSQTTQLDRFVHVRVECVRRTG